jgi:hypothetical protein
VGFLPGTTTLDQAAAAAELESARVKESLMRDAHAAATAAVEAAEGKARKAQVR